MKKKVTILLILGLATAMLASGCGKEKETQTDVVDLTMPPVAVENEEPEVEEPEEITHEGSTESSDR